MQCASSTKSHKIISLLHINYVHLDEQAKVISCVLLVHIFLCYLLVLSELPLPKKTKKEVISLFPNNKTSSDAWKIITKRDINLATQLANVLNQVNTDHLYVLL